MVLATAKAAATTASVTETTTTGPAKTRAYARAHSARGSGVRSLGPFPARRTSEKSPSETVRKGVGTTLQRWFGRYTEHEMAQKELLGSP
jgi:hypothetical protein